MAKLITVMRIHVLAVTLTHVRKGFSGFHYWRYERKSIHPSSLIGSNRLFTITLQINKGLTV